VVVAEKVAADVVVMNQKESKDNAFSSLLVHVLKEQSVVGDTPAWKTSRNNTEKKEEERVEKDGRRTPHQSVNKVQKMRKLLHRASNGAMNAHVKEGMTVDSLTSTT